MSAWQPIETVPKQPNKSDGDNVPMEFVVLLFDPDNSKDDRVQVGFWNNNHDGWWQTLFEYSVLIRPTHWMPLPEPPSS